MFTQHAALNFIAVHIKKYALDAGDFPGIPHGRHKPALHCGNAYLPRPVIQMIFA
ncbi:hypothetical protein [Acidithiobacillus thiooxidans]|uniref:hypothetical protein n=1 Tax=Acidithiobacillus thiooxidans TaxID=930 RepID=UPI003B5140F3